MQAGQAAEFRRDAPAQPVGGEVQALQAHADGYLQVGDAQVEDLAAVGVEDVELGRAILADAPGEPGWLGDDGSQAAIGRACELECPRTGPVVYWGVYLEELAAGGEVEDDRIAGAIGEREISWPEATALLRRPSSRCTRSTSV